MRTLGNVLANWGKRTATYRRALLAVQYSAYLTFGDEGCRSVWCQKVAGAALRDDHVELDGLMDQAAARSRRNRTLEAMA